MDQHTRSGTSGVERQLTLSAFDVDIVEELRLLICQCGELAQFACLVRDRELQEHMSQSAIECALALHGLQATEQ